MILPHEEMGSGAPIVLLHAGVADRRMWRDHLEPLAAAGYRATAMDLPGYGEARYVFGPQAPWNDILETMDELDMESAALVGNSLGAAEALRVAVLAPERVSALVLISAPAPGMKPSDELKAAWDEEEQALESGDIDAAVNVVVRTWTLPGAPPELREQVAAMQRRAYELQENATSLTEAADPLDEEPGALSRVTAPALCAVGEHDRLEFHESAQTLARTLPYGRFEVIPGAGHLAPLETPEAFRSLLLEFLSE